MNELQELINQKKADLDLMRRMVEDLRNTNQPVSEDLLDRLENLEKEIQILEK